MHNCANNSKLSDLLSSMLAQLIRLILVSLAPGRNLVFGYFDVPEVSPGGTVQSIHTVLECLPAAQRSALEIAPFRSRRASMNRQAGTSGSRTKRCSTLVTQILSSVNQERKT